MKKDSGGRNEIPGSPARGGNVRRTKGGLLACKDRRANETGHGIRSKFVMHDFEARRLFEGCAPFGFAISPTCGGNLVVVHLSRLRRKD